MAKALHRSTAGDRHDEQARDWRKGMSDNVAYALLVYTGLQIFLTVRAMKGDGHSMFPYLALIILVAAIIPACRWFEKRWSRLDDAAATDSSLAGAYRRDQVLLWALAIGLPIAITALFTVLGAIF